VMRATISSGGQTVAKLTRPFHILRTFAAAEGADSTVASSARLRPEIPRFTKEEALKPPIVNFFLDELSKFQSGAASQKVTAAMAAAKEGKFQELTSEISTEPGDRLVASFLRGLGLYSKGDLEAARRQFNNALAASPEFFPAIVYLGAVYAATGHDGEAVGAWQTSLSVETEVPVTFLFLADALFRMNDGEQAVSVLEEARDRWPDDERFVQRLATAYAMVGKQGDAVTLLEPYLATHGTDLDALFLAMRLIYEAHADGRTLFPDDGARLKRLADAYALAKGPQQAIVGQWVKFVDKEKK
jgi:predicted Zn-dependent protease